jgi:hypothetical protein
MCKTISYQACLPFVCHAVSIRIGGLIAVFNCIKSGSGDVVLLIDD